MLLKKVLLIFAVGILPTILKSENKTKEDSLFTYSKNGKLDTSSIKKMLALSKQLVEEGDYKKALKTGLHVNELLQKFDNTNILHESYINLGQINMMMGEYNQSLNYLFKSIDCAKETNNKVQLANSYIDIANTYASKFDFNKAIEYNKLGIEITEELNNETMKCNIYNNIALIHIYQKNYNTALNYLTKCLQLSKQMNNASYIANTYNNIGEVYSEKKEYQKAIKHHLKSLKIRDSIGDKKSIVVSFTNISNIYYVINMNNKSIEYGLKGLAIANELEDEFEIFNCESILLQNYSKLDKLDSATAYFNQAIRHVEKIEDREILSAFYLSASILSEKKGEFKGSLLYYKKHKIINDLIFDNNANEKNIEMLTKYETIQKDKEILKQKADQRQLWIFIGGALLIIVILFISLYFQIKSKNEIVSKTKLINKQDVDIARYQSQMNPHFVFNAMSSIQSLIVTQKNEEALLQLLAFTKLMRVTLNNSIEETISIFEEIDFLNQYVDFERRRFTDTIDFKLNIDEAINIKDTYITPMLIQPFIENSIKHGGLNKIKSAEIKIEIKVKNSDLLVIIITDNGIGIQKDENKLHQSKAIKITKERIKLFLTKSEVHHDSDFSIKNKTEGGVTVKFSIPFLENH